MSKFELQLDHLTLEKVQLELRLATVHGFGCNFAVIFWKMKYCGFNFKNQDQDKSLSQTLGCHSQKLKTPCTFFI